VSAPEQVITREQSDRFTRTLDANTIARAVRVDVPQSISHEQVLAAARILGFDDPACLSRLEIGTGYVCAVVKVRVDGHDILAHDGSDVLKRYVTIPLED
jgi:hypothetical protein